MSDQKYMDKKELKHLHNRIRHEFLLTFFDPAPHYAVRELNGYVLVKQLNQKREWEVAIYTKDNWRKVEEWKCGREADNQPLPMA